MTSYLLVFAAVIASVYGQCGPADNARCTNWVQGGFCTSTFYTLDYRKATCGSVCNLCPTSASAACAGTTENANCANWKNNGFCANAAYSDAQKRASCCRTCFVPVSSTPSTAGAVIYDGAGNAIINTGATGGVMQPVTSPTISKVFVKQGCTLKLTNGSLAPATGSPFVGANAFVTLTGDATTAIGYEVSCP